MLTFTSFMSNAVLFDFQPNIPKKLEVIKLTPQQIGGL